MQGTAAQVDSIGLQGNECGRGLGVRAGEVDHLAPLRADRQGIHHHIELACLEPRDQAVPILGDDRATGFHALAQDLGHLRLEAIERAVWQGAVPGFVNALRGDLDVVPLLGVGVQRETGNQHHQRAGGESSFFVVHLLILRCEAR
ncbi:hypothetical protein D3C72_1727020 [compost metagenome]